MILELEPKSTLLTSCIHSFSFVKLNWNQLKHEENSCKMIQNGRMDIWIIQEGDLFLSLNNRPVKKTPKFFTLGLSSKYMTATSSGKTRAICISIFPWSFLRLTGLASSDLTDKIVDLEFCMPPAFIDSLSEASNIIDEFDCRNALEEHFTNFLQLKHSSRDFIYLANQLIISSHGKLSVQQISSHLNVSRQHMTRVFKEEVGMAPKELGRVIRIRHSVDTLVEKWDANLTSLAYELEFFDQSHFIHQFIKMTGENPSSFYRRQHLIKGSLKK